jgi:hypothetical protein
VIRHVSVLTFVPDVSEASVRAIEAALAALPGRLQFRAYEFGRDLAINEGNAGFAVVADFDSLDDYVAYRDDPEHRRILAEVIRPVLAARSAVQYELPGA